jgi:uncharacterized protein YxjI
MEKIIYPLDLKFNISTLANDFTATDAEGLTIAYVRQKMFKLKEKVVVFSDKTKTTEKYVINANKWLDFNTSYNFSDTNGKELGRVARKGWKSLWKAKYELYDEQDKQDLIIQEENPWVKVFDALLGEVPVLSILSGYLFNPKYTITRPDGTIVARLSKQKSFFGRHFAIDKLAEFEEGEEVRVFLGSMMMLLLERRRG